MAAIVSFFGLNPDDPLPVTLNSFKASESNKSIILEWQTGSEIENYGFNLYRAEKTEMTSSAGYTYQKINEKIINGAGNSSTEHNYTFTDNDLHNNTTYLYMLEDISFSGKSSHSEPIEIKFIEPQRYALLPNYPNPFNPQTQITYQIAESQHVTLKIYDTAGREVQTLISSQQNAGEHIVTLDASGLAGGIYFYRLKAGPFESMRKMILLK